MSKYIIEGELIKLGTKTNGRIYDEKVFTQEIKRWKYRFRVSKIERILKEI
jgi:hypothetical protein